MNLLNAQLELRFELIRAVTPKYAQYKYMKSPNFEAVKDDNSVVTRAILQASKTAKKWTEINVDSATAKANVDRGLIVRKLQEWHDNGAIELQPSGVINRFRVLRDFPNDEQTKNEIARALYGYFEESEESGITRVHNVIDLLTAHQCLSRSLAKHFSDESTVSITGCGHCSVCITKKPVSFDRTKRDSRKGRINKTRFLAILAATNVRDDPRFLARIAFGITSPRVTANKLSKHPVFGSMDDCDFEVCIKPCA